MVFDEKATMRIIYVNEKKTEYRKISYHNSYMDYLKGLET